MSPARANVAPVGVFAMGNIDFVDLLFGFRGRINRGKFWLAVLIWLIIAIVGGTVQSTIVLYVSETVGVILGVLGFIGSIAGVHFHYRGRHQTPARQGQVRWLLLFWIAPFVLLGIGFPLLFYGGMVGGPCYFFLFFIPAMALAIWAWSSSASCAGPSDRTSTNPIRWRAVRRGFGKDLREQIGAGLTDGLKRPIFGL